MSTKITDSVGRGGKNLKRDVEIVQNLLSEYILANRLGPMSILDEEYAGTGSDTERAICEFQKRVMQVPPTGVVRKGSDEFASLLKPPKESNVLDIVYEHVDLWRRNGPPPGWNITFDMWHCALHSLGVHATHPRLKKYSMMTLVDFRISRKIPRLWVIDLYESRVLVHARVAHGRGPKKPFAGEVPNNFGEKFSSRLGAFITTRRCMVKAGQKPIGKSANVAEDDGESDDHEGVRPYGPAVRLIGLDDTNRMATRIGIIFHGAHYVTDRQVANSRGCFSTSFKDNVEIVERIKDGSFVYAFAGESRAPRA